MSIDCYPDSFHPVISLLYSYFSMRKKKYIIDQNVRLLVGAKSNYEILTGVIILFCCFKMIRQRAINDWRAQVESRVNLTKDEEEERYQYLLETKNRREAERWKKQQYAIKLWYDAVTFDEILAVSRRYISGELWWAPYSKQGQIPIRSESIRAPLLLLNDIGFITFTGQIGRRYIQPTKRTNPLLVEMKHHVAFDVRRTEHSLSFVDYLLKSHLAVSYFDSKLDKIYTNVRENYTITRRLRLIKDVEFLEYQNGDTMDRYTDHVTSDTLYYPISHRKNAKLEDILTVSVAIRKWGTWLEGKLENQLFDIWNSLSQ